MVIRRPTRRFTVDDYYRMAAAGVFRPEDRVELIEGEIVEMSPIGSAHAACVKRLNRLFSRHLGDRAVVSTHDPVRLDDRSEPEPDVALLKPRADLYAAAHPGPSDILLVVEVADTSAEYDREAKMKLYAAAGVLEAWLVDLPGQAIEVYRGPAAASYADCRRLGRGPAPALSPLAFPDFAATAEDSLGAP